MKKSEAKFNFDEKQLGHLVPLTVGHRDNPTGREIRYLETIFKSSGFLENERIASITLNDKTNDMLDNFNSQNRY